MKRLGLHQVFKLLLILIFISKSFSLFGGKKEKPRNSGLFLYSTYSGLIAPTGQVAAHEPQSIHFSSITYCASPSEMASTGQTEAQAPHEMHSLLILYMKFTSYVDHCNYYTIY
jgi:hypothetical protein